MKLLHALTFAILMFSLGVFYGIVSDMYPDKVHPNHAHITLYLDRNFEEYEDEFIMQAAWEWSEATNHIIEYDIVKLPTKEKIKFTDSVFFTRKGSDDPSIILSDTDGKKDTLGLYEFHHVHTIAMVSERIDYDRYKEIALHELGHSLGLEHLEGWENVDTLMFPYTSVKMDDGTVIPTGVDHITHKDLVAFCKLWHCNADKLQH